MPSLSFSAARDEIVRAQQRFRVSSLNRLMPTAHGTVRARVLLREQRLGNLYRLRMEGRLRHGMRTIRSDPTITDARREVKLRELVLTERRYLALHMAASSNRLERTAEFQRLKESGDPGAYWHMDPRKLTHTADCRAMDGRTWPWSILDRINPGNRHSGCGCKLLSIREAKARGFPIRWGRAIPEVATRIHEATWHGPGAYEINHPHEPRALRVGQRVRHRVSNEHGIVAAIEPHLRVRVGGEAVRWHHHDAIAEVNWAPGDGPSQRPDAGYPVRESMGSRLLRWRGERRILGEAVGVRGLSAEHLRADRAGELTGSAGEVQGRGGRRDSAGALREDRSQPLLRVQGTHPNRRPGNSRSLEAVARRNQDLAAREGTGRMGQLRPNAGSVRAREGEAQMPDVPVGVDRARLGDTPKQTLSVDFDGVIHAGGYKRPGGLMPGAKPELERLAKRYRLVCTTANPDLEFVNGFLEEHGIRHHFAMVTNVKQPAVRYLDDRAQLFTGWEEAGDELDRVLEAAQVQTGAMVALYPPPVVARKLALEGGEPPEQLHVTLVFLGKADSIEDVEKLKRVVAGWAASTPPMKGRIGGLGLFPASKTSDAKPVTFVPADIPQLTRHREALVKAIEAIGHKIPDEHGFTPHMTLAYADRRDVDPPLHENVPFGVATLMIAGSRNDYPFGGRTLRETALALLGGNSVGKYDRNYSPDHLREVDVPVRPGVHGGNPHHDEKGRFTTVHGDFHPALHDHAARYFDAVREGNGATMQKLHSELRQAALALSHGKDRISPEARDEQIRLVGKVHARAVVPSGHQMPYGHEEDIGGTRVKVPMVPQEEHGRARGWDGGGFSWAVGPHSLDSLGPRTERYLATLKRSPYFKVRKEGDVHIVEARGGKLTQSQMHAAAMDLEAHLNEFRTLRISSGRPVDDDRPLDLTADLANSTNDYTRHARVNRKDLGNAGEALLPEIAEAMSKVREPREDPETGKVTLGKLLFPGAKGPFTPISLEAEARGEKQTNLDAGIGVYGAEFKSTPWRMLTAARAEGEGTGRKASFGGTVKESSRLQKIAMAEKQGLEPVNVYPIPDLDGNHAHVFVHPFRGHFDGKRTKERPRGKWVSETGEKVFGERRIPVELQTALIDGTAVIGKDYKPTRVKHGEPTIYLGTFTLPLNPIVLADMTPELRGRRGPEARAKAVLERMRAPRRGRAQIAERDARILEYARSGLFTQGEIAAKVGLKQPAVSTILRKKHHFQTGQGRRSDLRAARR